MFKRTVGVYISMRQKAREANGYVLSNAKHVHFSDKSHDRAEKTEDEADHSGNYQSFDEYDSTMYVSITALDIALLSSTLLLEENSWILDYGATDHCTTNTSDFSSYVPLDSPQDISGICCKAVGKGDINAIVQSTIGKHVYLDIKDVHCTLQPDLQFLTVDYCPLPDFSKTVGQPYHSPTGSQQPP